MAVRKYFIAFIAMLASLSLGANADIVFATEAEIKAPFGCNTVQTSSKLVATYSSPPYTDELCGKKYTVTCLSDGSGGTSSSGNPCNSGKNHVTVTMVGACGKDCNADIQLSTGAYDSIVGVEDSVSIYVNFVPA